MTVGVAYGSDVDQVREVLLDCARQVENLSKEPSPRVRFRAFGDSGLRLPADGLDRRARAARAAAR